MRTDCTRSLTTSAAAPDPRAARSWGRRRGVRATRADAVELLHPAGRPGVTSSSGRAGTEAFPRGARLLRSRDFERVLADGRRFQGRMLGLSLVASGDGRCRLGLTVPRRVGGAVERNRVRRVLRDVFRRQVRASLEAAGRGADIVVRVFPPAAEADHAALSEEFVSLSARWLRVRLPGPPSP